ncbi:MAG: TlpA disulfide reductase family protein [Polyangiaceae bacterium]
MRTIGLLVSTLVAGSLLAACGGEDTIKDGTPFEKGQPGQVSSGNGGSGGDSTGGTGGEVSSPDVPDYLADYPEGPYGTELHSVLPNYRFKGWSNPQAVEYDVEQMETVQLSDFYDPDGSKNIKILLINSSAQWCSPCKQEYSHFKTKGTFAEYREKGVMFLGSLMENNNYDPPVPANGAAWVKSFEVAFPFVVDTSFKLGGLFSIDAIPNNTLVNAKTMEIIQLLPGGDTAGLLAAIDAQLKKL